jgi:hypothetical protein
VQVVPIAVTRVLSCPARYQHEVDSQWWWWCVRNFSCLHKRSFVKLLAPEAS